MTMRHSALFACRSPQRLSRCRWVFPDEAWIGLTPSRAAKERSLLSRSGLSPAASRTALTVSGACAVTGQHRWSGGCDDSVPAVPQPGDLGVEFTDAGGEFA